MKNKKNYYFNIFLNKKIKKKVRDSLTILLPRVFGFFFFPLFIADVVRTPPTVLH